MSVNRPKTPILTVDSLIINKKGEVLMIKRNYFPFVGFWVLPGGHVKYGERVETALKREIFEETNLKIKSYTLFGVYSDPKRDPRYHTVSLAYFCQSINSRLKGNRESTAHNFFPLNKLPKDIGFDHRKIINDFKKWNNKS
ncbi:MAG: NUDIX hydrolase [Patescibacteria group bacterium]|jgi:ADP-ribose pyrophosphatase YjhB (NUDIX family)